MKELTRITFDPKVMGGRPCVRRMRVTVGTVGGLLAAGRTREDVLAAYPYLEREGMQEVLTHATWRAEEVEAPMARP